MAHKTSNRVLWGRRNTVSRIGNVYDADGDFIGQVVRYRDGWRHGGSGPFRTRREAVSSVRRNPC